MPIPQKPTKLPRWAESSPTYLTEPPENGATADSKDNGWSGAKPPAGFMNWLFLTIYQWLFLVDFWFDNRRDLTLIGLSIVKTSDTSITETHDWLGIGPWALDASFSGKVADTSIVGAGGIDVGTQADLTWYAIWGIWNPTGANFDIMVSTSFTNPTMPTGYTMKRRLGFVYSDSSTHFTEFQIINDEFLHLKNPEYSLSGGETQDGVFHTAVFNSETSPDILTEVRLQGRVGANLQSYTLYLRPTGSSWTANEATRTATALGSDYISGSGGNTEFSTFARSMLQTASREFDYQANNGGSPGVVYLAVTGFRLPPYVGV